MIDQKEKTIVFVGGSVVSMMLALHYKKNLKSKSRIIILEKAKELGGLYRSFRYEDDVCFDYGVHIYTETTNPTIDQLFIDILGENGWGFMADLRRDLSGTYYNGKFQQHTPFVDLRDIPEEKKNLYVESIRSSAHNDINPNSYKTAEDFLTAKFGKVLYEEVFKPIVVKHYKTDPSLLDPMATHVIPVGRIVLHDEDEMEKLMGDEALRTRIAFPDQYSLPSCYLRPGRLIYPKEFGMYKLIEKFKALLESYGVEFYTEANFQGLQLEGRVCQKVSFSTNGKDYSVDNVSQLFWNGGYPGLAAQLGMENKAKKPSFIKLAFVNMLLDKPANVGDLYYMYNFKPGTHIFRVVNYYNYCPASVTEKGYPICATTLLHDYQGDPKELVIKELKEIGVITDHKINFIEAESSDHAFPQISADFIEAIDAMRAEFRSRNYENIHVTGMLAEKGHFYLTEALEYAFSLVKSKQTVS